MIWPTRGSARRPEPRPEESRSGSRPVLIHALDGFLGAGSATSLAADQLRSGGDVVHEYDIDAMFDYRARRPTLAFRDNRYQDYDTPRLVITREIDLNGTEFFLLSGPEPDFLWERFVRETVEQLDVLGVGLVLGLGAVPMGVPHTRPVMITAHGTRPELVDRQNLWTADVTVPASAQAMLEFRLGEMGRDAGGYVVHVPHYLAQFEFPDAALALLEAIADRTGLHLDTTQLQARQEETRAQIEAQIIDQGGAEVLHGLEQQYDAFARGAAQSLLAHDEELPSGEELADQFEQFLAKQRKDDQS